MRDFGIHIVAVYIEYYYVNNVISCESSVLNSNAGD